MELRQTKPIHLRCPKCGYDFSYNSNYVEEEIDRLKIEISSIMARIEEYKREHKNWKSDLAYRNLQVALKKRQARIIEAKKARKATAIEIKLQTNQIFKKLVEQKMGVEETQKLLKEAEEQLIYYNYDTACQTFTRFEKV